MNPPERSRHEMPATLRGQAQHFPAEHGSLYVFDQADVPFTISRFFYIVAPKGARRGDHAHRKCHQYLIAVTGAIRILIDSPDGTTFEILLRPGHCVHVPPMHWALEFFEEEHSALLVLCDLPFDESDYIRVRVDFDEELRNN